MHSNTAPFIGRSTVWIRVGRQKNSYVYYPRVTTQPEPSAGWRIVLLHVGNATTARALPDILRILKARHFECVSVSSLITTSQNWRYVLSGCNALYAVSKRGTAFAKPSIDGADVFASVQYWWTERQRSRSCSLARALNYFKGDVMKIKTGQFGSGLPNADWKLNEGTGDEELSGNILISERVFRKLRFRL